MVLDGSSEVSPGPSSEVNSALGSCSLWLLSLEPPPLTGQASGPRKGSYMFLPGLSVVSYVGVVVGFVGVIMLQLATVVGT